MEGYRIDRLPDAGFVVSEAPSDMNRMARVLFGCSEIDDALGYVKDKLAPAPADVADVPGPASVPVPPRGYERLPDGVRCRCVDMLTDGAGGFYCCKARRDA